MNNPRIRINSIKILSDNWYTLKKADFDYQLEDGTWQNQLRESYDKGNGVAILLTNPENRTVILTRQFRMPTYLNGNSDGMMLEVPAGVIEDDEPEHCIKREVEEETGYSIEKVTKVFESYMSPGAVTEILHFYTGNYTENQKTGPGGGNPEETENIEVLEYTFEEIKTLLNTNEITDAKTILLLQYGIIHGIIT